MEKKELDQIKGQFAEVVEEKVSPLAQKIDDQGSKLKEIEEKVGKLEDAPTGKAPAINSIPQKHRGYKLNIQGGAIKNLVHSNPSQYEAFAKDGKLDEEKVDAYTKWMLDLVQFRVFGNREAQGSLQKASYAEGADATGGYLVPEEYEFDIIKLARNRTFGLQECSVVQMGSDKLNIPTEATLASGTWETEASTINAGEGTVGNLQLVAKKYASLLTVSNEMLADSRIDFVSTVTEQLAYDTLLNGVDNQILNGDGTVFQGIIAGSGSSKNVNMASTKTTFADVTADNLSSMINELDQGFLANAKFVFNPLIKHYLRILKDSQNAYIFQMPQGANAGTIWEKPYIESEVAPSSTAISTPFIVLGNLKLYYVGIRRGLSALDVDPYGKFDTDETRLRLVTRWGLGSGQASGFVTLTTAAA